MTSLSTSGTVLHATCHVLSEMVSVRGARTRLFQRPGNWGAVGCKLVGTWKCWRCPTTCETKEEKEQAVCSISLAARSRFVVSVLFACLRRLSCFGLLAWWERVICLMLFELIALLAAELVEVRRPRTITAIRFGACVHWPTSYTSYTLSPQNL